ncbi:MAG: hypothetical protein ACREE4_13855 [Stellaceae bacterium]
MLEHEFLQIGPVEMEGKCAVPASDLKEREGWRAVKGKLAQGSIVRLRIGKSTKALAVPAPKWPEQAKTSPVPLTRLRREPYEIIREALYQQKALRFDDGDLSFIVVPRSEGREQRSQPSFADAIELVRSITPLVNVEAVIEAADRAKELIENVEATFQRIREQVNTLANQVDRLTRDAALAIAVSKGGT